MALVFEEASHGGRVAFARRRVCPTCAGRGMLVCAKFRTVKVERTVRSDTVDAAIRQLNTYAAMARANGQTEREEAYDAAIEVLKRHT